MTDRRSDGATERREDGRTARNLTGGSRNPQASALTRPGRIPDLHSVKSLTRALALALLLAASLTGMTNAAGACDHSAAAGDSHHQQAPDQPPCSHDQPGHPAAPCAVMPTCAGAVVAMSAPLVTIAPAADVVVAAASPTESLASFRPTLDVPPPRL